MRNRATNGSGIQAGTAFFMKVQCVSSTRATLCSILKAAPARTEPPGSRGFKRCSPFRWERAGGRSPGSFAFLPRWLIREIVNLQIPNV